MSTHADPATQSQTATRTESDSMGKIEVRANVYGGADATFAALL
jgi:hypothetical protein